MEKQLFRTSIVGGLTLNIDEYLYVSDLPKNEVRRWNTNGRRKSFKLTVSYFRRSRSISLCFRWSQSSSDVMGERGAKEGIVVADGQGQEKALGQLYNPCGMMVDQ